MKKVIALVLAIIMTLSIGVVAFAADEAPAEPSTEEVLLGEILAELKKK